MRSLRGLFRFSGVRNVIPIPKTNEDQVADSLTGVVNVETSMPACEVPVITVTFACKFFPHAPECYELMARALVGISLAFDDVGKFAERAREIVAQMVEEERMQLPLDYEHKGRSLETPTT